MSEDDELVARMDSRRGRPSLAPYQDARDTVSTILWHHPMQEGDGEDRRGLRYRRSGNVGVDTGCGRSSVESQGEHEDQDSGAEIRVSF